MRLILLMVALCVTQTTWAQKKKKEKIEYEPITNTTLEEAFPVATQLLVGEGQLGIHEFNYGNQQLSTTHFEYYRGISAHRGRWQFSIDESGTFNVDVVEVEWKHDGVWEPTSSEGLFVKTEYKLRAALADQVREKLEDPNQVAAAKDWFFTNLEVNNKFFETATDLAGDRWFERYLENTPVEWPLTFIDIERSTSDPDFRYREFYARVTALDLGMVDYEDHRFFVTKFTNNDANALTTKGTKVPVTGYCRSLEFNQGVFYVLLTDELTDQMPTTTLAAQEAEGESATSLVSVADEIKKLKELLDMEAITQEEYDQEKQKLLNK
ncbi:MAG: SHOCT domain-containing protein [Tunicatimonas sp.]